MTFYGLKKRFDYDIKYDASEITEEILTIDGNNEFLSEKLDDVSKDLTSEFKVRCATVEPSATGEFNFFDTSQVKFRTDCRKLEKIEIDTFHKNDNGELIAFNLFSEESAGTQRVASLVPLFLWAVSTGKTIFVDEFESSLH